jgi:hypothetical protein
MKLFPLFLKLEGRRCLVVGAGSIAESKITGLVDTGSEVVVVAPEARPEIQALAVAKKVEWHKRAFAPADLNGMFLVVAATSSTAVHQRIFREAHLRGGALQYRGRTEIVRLLLSSCGATRGSTDRGFHGGAKPGAGATVAPGAGITIRNRVPGVAGAIGSGPGCDAGGGTNRRGAQRKAACNGDRRSV